MDNYIFLYYFLYNLNNIIYNILPFLLYTIRYLLYIFSNFIL